ncbi:GNAT family N-acetyltransferase [Paenibacillus donghaensis]|uniref:GNAT family N-acetyltransferase n=1 Tax=Paenibacillus donghaensis TaxID=414771 RepID=A0A2Z2KLJ2_9BACL|nr:GNAT family N-acetyltransferase [Paenibacillus donghaensis]ASA20841.1 GNAT family N-acetyltransferase [Paenibacillus donghaensis]
MVVIKKIDRESLPELAELYQELTQQTTDLSKLEQAFADIQGDGRYVLLGAFVEGELFGSLMGIVCQDLVGDCRSFMVIENVVVSVRARRQGVGSLLMAAIEAKAQELDCYYIILVSGERRKEAHRFYERMGYGEDRVQGFKKFIS